MGKTDLNRQNIQKMLTKTRTSILLSQPFYGSILMGLKFGTASCGTACTDMKRLLFDPEFVLRLAGRPRELEFVMLHEVLHCVLLHPVRARGRLPRLYNMAADVVVNAHLMQLMGVTDFEVDGAKVMWRVPDGGSGHLYTAEQVYQMLVEQYGCSKEDEERFLAGLSGQKAVLDTHDVWSGIPVSSRPVLEWKESIRTASAMAGEDSMPPVVRTILEEEEHAVRLNWKQILRDFLQRSFDSYDYTFSPADRRFQSSPFILPAFWEREEEKAKNLWFMVDASGSVDDRILTEILAEIRACLKQLPQAEGKLSFFDTSVTEPLEFGGAEDLKKAIPKGGGGTSFFCIFEYLRKHASPPPSAVIILTDGHARYPPQKNAMGIPVLWILAGNTEEAPWGRTVHMD